MACANCHIAIGIHASLHGSNTLIMWVIVVYNVRTRLDTLNQLYVRMYVCMYVHHISLQDYKPCMYTQCLRSMPITTKVSLYVNVYEMGQSNSLFILYYLYFSHVTRDIVPLWSPFTQGYAQINMCTHMLSPYVISRHLPAAAAIRHANDPHMRPKGLQ